MAEASAAPARGSRGDYGQRWGEGAARCFSLESDPLDDDESVRLTPIPECFICPMSQTPMEDPVMTVDGCVYERTYIEQWIRHRQQHRLRVTSPATNQELPSHRLVSLTALQKAIEAYLAHRPELRGSLTASRSFEEAAQMLQSDLLEKQAAHVGAEDELSLLRDSNEVLMSALSEAERSSNCLRQELHILEENFQIEKASHDTLLDKFEVSERQVKELTTHLRKVASDDVKNLCTHCGEVLEGKNADRGQQAGVDGSISVAGRSRHISTSNCANRHNLKAFLGVGKSTKILGRPGSAYLCIIFALSAAGLAGVFFRGYANGAGNTDRGQNRQPVSDTISAAIVAASENWTFHTEEVRKEELRWEETRMDESIEEERRQEDQERRQDERRKRKREEERIRKKIKEDRRGFEHMSEDGHPIDRQVSLLRSGSEEEKIEAALVLSILATAKPENQAAIVRAGAISQLVGLLQGESSEGRGQAAVALRAIAANNTYNKVAIVRAGAIGSLIRLLKDEPVEVQEVARSALETLAETNHQVEIAQAGAIVPLVALLKDERPGVREEAAGALVILALNADNQAAIAQVGALPLLVDLLKDSAPEVREQAAAALRNLAAENIDNQAAIARAGAFAPLADLLKDELPGIREEALAALRNLAGFSGEEAVREAALAAGLAIRDSWEAAAGER